MPRDEIVLAAMPLSAELRLTTPLRIAIHPQFEAGAGLLTTSVHRGRPVKMLQCHAVHHFRATLYGTIRDVQAQHLRDRVQDATVYHESPKFQCSAGPRYTCKRSCVHFTLQHGLVKQ